MSNTNTTVLENLTESQAQISETLTTFLNDWNKDANYRDIAMKEQNRHLARIASALEKLAGGTTISSHNKNYEKKLEADKQSAEEVKGEEVKTKEVEPEQSEKEYTHDELKKLCLSKSREDLANKPKLKALLKEYGAAKANDVPDDKLAELIERINKGEF
jgi:ABC-type Fe3+-citrate transport system substrate-binding protein